MTVQLSSDMLHKHAAPNFSQFVSADIPDLSAEIAGAENWPATYVIVAAMEDMFGRTVLAPNKQFGTYLLLCARNAAIAYTEARERTLQFLDEEVESIPAVTAYFNALARWEEVFSNLQKAFDILYRGIGKRGNLYRTGDGSLYERTNGIANAIKHGVADTSSSAVAAGVPMWLANEGFQTAEFFVSWSEAAEWVTELTRTAEILMTPLYELSDRQPAPTSGVNDS